MTEPWPTTQWVHLRVKVRHQLPPLSSDELAQACEVRLTREDLQLIDVEEAPPVKPQPTLFRQFLNVLEAVPVLALGLVMVLAVVAFVGGLSSMVFGWP